MRNRFLSTALSLLLLAGCIANSSGFGLPLPDAEDRPTLLTFGLYVTPDPANNPIDPPERFIGYHTGTDFEIFPNEVDTDVAVYAICPGKVLYSAFAEGYGGVIVQSCSLGGQDVTVLYGHLLLTSLVADGTELQKGDQIALLAPAKSHDSDGNRKHLHLDIHKGKDVVYLGYVQDPKELQQFIDPLSVLPL